MKAYIENIPFDVDKYTNKIQIIQHDFSKYIDSVLLFKTESIYLDSVRNWYQKNKNVNFHIYYKNGKDVMFTNCYVNDWQYNSCTGFIEIEIYVSIFIFMKKLYETEERKAKLKKIECQKYL